MQCAAIKIRCSRRRGQPPTVPHEKDVPLGASAVDEREARGVREGRRGVASVDDAKQVLSVRRPGAERVGLGSALQRRLADCFAARVRRSVAAVAGGVSVGVGVRPRRAVVLSSVCDREPRAVIDARQADSHDLVATLTATRTTGAAGFPRAKRRRGRVGMPQRGGVHCRLSTHPAVFFTALRRGRDGQGRQAARWHPAITDVS